MPQAVLAVAAILFTGLGVLFAVAPHWTAATAAWQEWWRRNRARYTTGS